MPNRLRCRLNDREFPSLGDRLAVALKYTARVHSVPMERSKNVPLNYQLISPLLNISRILETVGLTAQPFRESQAYPCRKYFPQWTL